MVESCKLQAGCMVILQLSRVTEGFELLFERDVGWAEWMVLSSWGKSFWNVSY